METVRKKISLEGAKNRNISLNLPYYGDTDYVMDFVCSGSVDASEYSFIPVVKYRNQNIIRYKNIMSLYYWSVNTFIPSCVGYKLCKRNNSDVWLRQPEFDVFEYTGNTVVEKLSDLDMSEFEYGDMVIQTIKCNDFIDKFSNSPEVAPFENFKKFFVLLKHLFEDGEYLGGPLSVPYMDINLYIEQEYTDIGEYSCYEQYWIPGKTYYSGDTVFYSTDGTYDNMKCYTLTVEKYSGYFNTKTKTIEFDEPENPHWTEIVPTEEHEMECNGYCDSQLQTIKRKKNYIDESGKTHDFILHYTIDSTTGKKILDTENTEFNYMFGFDKIVVNEFGEITCNKLNSVTFYEDDSFEGGLVKTSGDTRDGIILVNGDFENYKYIKFNYSVGGELIKSGDNYIYNEGTGVSYEETRGIVIEHFKYSDTINLPYLIISENTYESANLGKDGAVSKITFVGEDSGKDNVYGVHMFKDNSINGVLNVNKNINTNIERGTSASFERHNALMEISTMQDLEHYRNDYFKVNK